MDRPRSPLGWVIRLVLIAACAMIATALIYTAIGFVTDFTNAGSDGGFGNAGYLFLAALAMVFSAPFIALTLALGLPIVSNDPRFRGADR